MDSHLLLSTLIHLSVRLSERMTKRDQEPILTKELLKAKKTAMNILRNQVDALHNVNFARKEFEESYKAAIEANEIVQKNHLTLLKEYMKTKLEYKFALKKAENLKKMSIPLKEHYESLKELTIKTKEIADRTPIIEGEEKPRQERVSSVSSRESTSLGAYGSLPKHIINITDRLFESAGLSENYLNEDDYK